MDDTVVIDTGVLFGLISEQLEAGRDVSFTVTGMSMWPFLCSKRDQVTIRRCSGEEVKKGDVVLLQVSDDQYLLHRITDTCNTEFETTGDGNCFRDGQFPGEYIRAKVVRICRKGKEEDPLSRKWKLYAGIWNLLFPVRPALLKVLKTIGNMKHRH